MAEAAQTAGASSLRPSGHQFPSFSANNCYVHQGDIHNYGVPPDLQQATDKVVDYGLCLRSAPLIDPGYFVGRIQEIETISQILQPSEPCTEQRRLILGGIGGVGKTQLALAYAQRYRASYSSVFWLNATSDQTLKSSLREIAGQVLKPQDLDSLNDEAALARTLTWMADVQNTRWLVIFDNYDQPELLDIKPYCPYASHGSIIITTRLPDKVAGRQMRIQPLQDIDESIEILQARSGRANTKSDDGARRLAERLKGLPLALATAGAYLRKRTITFKQYLDSYEQRWNVDPRRPLQLQDYQDRTLYTTWNLSFFRLETDDPEAAQMLKLLAYFDHQEVWYELLCAGNADHLPVWLQESLVDQLQFESIIGTLVDYCLVEVQHENQSYSMHSCVHDWTLGELNKIIDPQLYWYAFACVAGITRKGDWDRLKQLQYARVGRHALRLTHYRFRQNYDSKIDPPEYGENANWIANLLMGQEQFSAAEWLYLQLLAEKERELGHDDISTFYTVHSLGLLYRRQGNLKKAELMYKRVLTGYESAFGSNHKRTLDVVGNLGSLYCDQDRLNEAEQMCKRALAGYESALGLNDDSTLNMVNNLGVVYHYQGRYDEAKQMHERALAGYEGAPGSNPVSTLDTFHFLGVVYSELGNLDEAERMYDRALAGYKDILGPNHTSTLKVVNGLGVLYRLQKRLDEAEQMYERSMTGTESVLGPNNSLTLTTAKNLGSIYRLQGRFDEAEKMFQRTIKGVEHTLGPCHTLTLDSQHCLANLYLIQDREDEAESMFQHLLPAYEKALGESHPSTLLVVHNIGLMYTDLGRPQEAEQMHHRALLGYESLLGEAHATTCRVRNCLEDVYRRQGKLAEADQVSERALFLKRSTIVAV